MVTARSYLFVPATRLDRVAKASKLDVDVVIVDLEDAVAPADKDRARASLGDLALERKFHVRINAVGTAQWRDDVEFCSALDVVEAIVVPMVSSPEEFETVRGVLVRPLSIVALVETPRGIQGADEIAAAGFARLMFGGVDYCNAMGTSSSPEIFAYPRSKLAVASAAAGLLAPVDGPTVAFDDPVQLKEDLKAARALGMGGKLCIHPNQLASVHEAFAPSEADLAWAREVVTQAQRHAGAVFSLDGEMIDQPVIERARRILQS